MLTNNANGQIYQGLIDEKTIRRSEDPFDFDFTPNQGQLVDIKGETKPNISYYSILGGRQYFIGSDSIWHFNSRYDKDSEIDSVTGFVITFPSKLGYGFEGMAPTSTLSHYYLPHINLQDVVSNNVLWQHDVWSNVDLTLNSTGELEYVFKAIDENAFNQITCMLMEVLELILQEEVLS